MPVIHLGKAKQNMKTFHLKTKNKTGIKYMELEDSCVKGRPIRYEMRPVSCNGVSDWQVVILKSLIKGLDSE